MEPTVESKIIDKSGLFKDKEAKLAVISFSKNTLPRKSLSKMSTYNDEDYKSIINSAFPCTDTETCITNIETAKNSLKKKSVSDLEKFLEIDETEIPIYEQDLNNRSSYLNVVVQSNNKKIIGKRTVHYKVKAASVIETNSSKLHVDYIISAIDYEDVFPMYRKANKDIELTFKPYSKVLEVKNLSDEYIQVNSIGMYYNQNVYEIVNNTKQNFAIEIAPHSKKQYVLIEEDEPKNLLNKKYTNLQLYFNIPDADYSEMTKEKAKKINFDFGFSMKYNIGDSNKDKTLYGVKKVNLYNDILR